MTAVHAGETAAYRALVDEFGPRVYSLALSVTGSYQMAEETTEEVFRQVRDHPADPAGPPIAGRAGISRLAHNSAVRRARAERTTTAIGPDRLPDGMSYGSPLLDRLTADEAAALQVTYFEGRTLRQAASILEHPVTVLVEQIRSALAKLNAGRDG